MSRMNGKKTHTLHDVALRIERDLSALLLRALAVGIDENNPSRSRLLSIWSKEFLKENLNASRPSLARIIV